MENERRRPNILKKLFNMVGSSSYETVLEKPRRNLERHYKLQHELGKGYYGTTYLCRDKKSNARYACKTISKDKVSSGDISIEYLRREVKVLKSIPSHPNIVSLIETYEDKKNVYLIMELCERGELSQRLNNIRYYEETEAKGLLKTVMQVIQWLHIHGIMHRDIKPANFLFGRDHALKAIDFGFATFFKPGQMFRDFTGTPGFIAPEIFIDNYGPEVDVWSAGVVLHQILCGRLLFSWEGNREQLRQKTFNFELDFRSELWPRVSEEAKALLKGMLERDPSKRLTPCQILNHPWLRNDSGVSNVRSVQERPAEEGYPRRSNFGR